MTFLTFRCGVLWCQFFLISTKHLSKYLLNLYPWNFCKYSARNVYIYILTSKARGNLSSCGLSSLLSVAYWLKIKVVYTQSRFLCLLTEKNRKITVVAAVTFIWMANVTEANKCEPFFQTWLLKMIHMIPVRGIYLLIGYCFNLLYILTSNQQFISCNSWLQYTRPLS